MIMKRYITLLLLVAVCGELNAESIKGRVVAGGDGVAEPLPGAVVQWVGSDGATITDEKGRFSISRSSKSLSQLVATFVGYRADTLSVGGEMLFTLLPDAVELDDVVVQNRRSNSISTIAMEKKESITFAGLCKMACCNIAESFENSASVTVGYSDAVSGARQIKLLGYSGTYTQMLDETRPIMRGLSSTYGLEYTPGMWLQGIQISKGVTSVVNGYEALTGQINIEHRKPTDDDPLFVNVFLNEELRAEANITSALKINDKLSTVILTHVSKDNLEMDHNGDGFLDMPMKQQYNVGNRWLYMADNGVQIRYGVRMLYEEREGGETDFNISDRASMSHYGSNIENKDFNTYVKAGVPLKKNLLEIGEDGYDDETTSNIALVADYTYHKQDAFFGLKDYSGDQNSIYVNLLYQINFGQKHQLIAGATFTGDRYNELLSDCFTTSKLEDGSYTVSGNSYNLDRDLYTVGAFGEYTLRLADKFDVVAGVRGDHNNKYGWMFTPRGHVKWNVTPRGTLRASAGVGYRISSIVTDNIGMLATGRELSFAEDLNPMERGFTAGGSYTQTFRLFGDDAASISVDYFRSEFTDQIVVDQESSSSKILFYNLDGDSYTNTYQIDFSWEPITRFNIFATYRYNDTRVTLRSSEVVETPLIDRFKGLVNLQYATKFDRWIFDFTAQINGQSRLPYAGVTTDSYSPVYPMFYGQVTRKLGRFDIYLGCENIGNYTQDDPIISSGDPFSSSFNSTVIWGPITGRKFYAGFRFNL